MYEMEEASSAPPHQGSQSPGQLALRAARQGQAPVRKSSFPVFLTSRSFLQVVPVSGGESISTASSRHHARAFGQLSILFFPSTRYPQKTSGYPHPAAVFHYLIHNSSTGYRT